MQWQHEAIHDEITRLTPELKAQYAKSKDLGFEL
jgi:hypothetical protein